MMGLFDAIFPKPKTAQDQLNQSSRPQPIQPQPKTPSGSVLAVVQISEIYQLKGVGLVPVGTVISGTLCPKYVCYVNGKVGTVLSIEAHHEVLPQAVVGDKIGFRLGGLVKADLTIGQQLEFMEP